MEKYVIDHQLYAPNGVHTNRLQVSSWCCCLAQDAIQQIYTVQMENKKIESKYSKNLYKLMLSKDFLSQKV